jgi:NADPH-dependent 7-cyano-7-deazaguanine reductase QueF-like protein
MHPKMTVISGMETYFLPNIYTVLEMKIEFTSPNQILASKSFSFYLEL